MTVTVSITTKRSQNRDVSSYILIQDFTILVSTHTHTTLHFGQSNGIVLEQSFHGDSCTQRGIKKLLSVPTLPSTVLSSTGHTLPELPHHSNLDSLTGSHKL